MATSGAAAAAAEAQSTPMSGAASNSGAGVAAGALPGISAGASGSARPAQGWSVSLTLRLVSAVCHLGSVDDWEAVAKLVNSPNHDAAACAARYAAACRAVAGAASAEPTSVQQHVQAIRVKELTKRVQEMEAELRILTSDMVRIASGKADSQLEEILARVDAEDALPIPSPTAAAAFAAAASKKRRSSTGTSGSRSATPALSARKKARDSSVRRASSATRLFYRVDQAHGKIDQPILLKAWQAVFEHPSAAVFHHPVPVDAAPLYDNVIKRRMDLSTVRQRIQSGEVSTACELYRDLLLTFQNAMVFNIPGSDIYEIARKLREFSAQQLQDALCSARLVPSGTDADAVPPTPAAALAAPVSVVAAATAAASAVSPDAVVTAGARASVAASSTDQAASSAPDGAASDTSSPPLPSAPPRRTRSGSSTPAQSRRSAKRALDSPDVSAAPPRKRQRPAADDAAGDVDIEDV